MSARYIIGDTREVTASLPDGSVDLVLTSPPFLALRSYLPADHPLKGLEIGSEPDPASFLDVLLELTAEWGRVLAPHGSICVELGDTYSGGAADVRAVDRPQDDNGGYQAGQRVHAPGHKSGIRNMNNKVQGGGPGWPLAKSLCGIPHLYHLSLAYGRNLLTGEPSPAGRWRVRNVVAWCRPNPPVGALGDKFRPATSYLTIATKAKDRYFDLDAVRGNPDDVKDQRHRTTNGPKQAADPNEVLTANYLTRVPSNPAGAPPLDYWVIPPAPYAGSHYAVYPPALCERPIESMVPRKVCAVCGEPSRRITGEYTLDSYRSSDRTQTIRAVELADAANLTDEHIAAIRAFGISDVGKAVQVNSGAGKNSAEVQRLAAEAKDALGGYFREFVMGTNAARGSTWSDCGHDSWRNGVVLDPFAGSGTTLMVASGHGRDSIGIDLDERNAELALDRVGPLLLEVVDMREKAAS